MNAFASWCAEGHSVVQKFCTDHASELGLVTIKFFLNI